MTDNEFEIFIKEQDFIGSDFFEESFKFWFEDNEHIRTPFPVEIQEKLKELLDKVILPRKGKLSEENKKIEYSDEFIQARHKHSAVESSINGLEKGGLDRCPDHGINGFKRYVALAVLARNIQTIGNMVQQKELKRQKRLKKAEQEKYRFAA